MIIIAVRQYVRVWIVRNKVPKKASEERMNTRVALIGIVVENSHSIPKLNQILHQYGIYIIGRMGIPYPKRQVNIISIAIDAPADIISALAGKLGRLPGVSSKTVYSKLSDTTEKEKGIIEGNHEGIS